ncbi:MAG: hypothetical protein ACMVY4_02395 [Minwuia sp.]|uniref:hypothetical protein n=1 Tax=Minwuia sp. TaxID=2493630 RepID=UPI003A857D2C
MSSDAIRVRKVNNAQKSTGPRTAAGEAVVAGNARRHGATARPDPEAVDTWLALILDKPDISASDLLPGDEVDFRALALAEAEVRVARCEQALVDFEAGRPEIGDDVQNVINAGFKIREEIEIHGSSPKELRSANVLLRRIERMTAKDLLPGGRQHRLLIRYLREARARHRRAFAAFCA